MKQVSIVTLIALLIAFAGTAQASRHHNQDSVFIELEKQNLLILTSLEKANLQDFPALDPLLKELASNLDAIKESVTDPMGHTSLLLVVTKDGKHNLVIDHKPEAQRALSWSNGEDATPGKIRPDRLEMRFPNGNHAVFVIHSIDELTDLAANPIDPLLAEIIPRIPEVGPMRKRGPALLLHSPVPEGDSRELVNHTKGQDLIELKGGGGLGLVRNVLVPEFGINVGLVLHGRSLVPSKMLTAKYAMQYFFSENAEGAFRTDIESFAMLEYGWNYSSNPAKPSWFNVGVGYLLSNQSDMYSGTTMKLYITQHFKSGIFFAPELYATNDLGNFFPGVRVGIGI